MTEYTVGAGGDFPTLTAASKGVKPDDVVNVLPGVYKERVAFDTPGVTWLAAPGAIVDGGWNGKTVESGFAAQVQLQARGVAVSGLTVRNCPGRGIGVQASDTIVRGCLIENTYHGGMMIGDSSGPAISNVLIDGNTLRGMSRSWVTEKNPQGVNGSCNVHNVRDSIIQDNELYDGWGEGFNLGRGCWSVALFYNRVHSNNHVLVYINRSQECVIASNRIYHVPDPTYKNKRNEWSAAIVIGDESGPAVSKWPNSRGNVIRGNIVVNAGKLLQVRNNKHNYDTQLLDTTIESNTFVAGPETEQGIIIQSNLAGRPHRDSAFRGNVIDFTHARKGADIGSHGQDGGIEFEGNVWSEEPPQSMRGRGDVIGDPQLARPDAPREPFDVDNYRPVAGGRTDVAQAGALEPLPATPTEPPPPDPPPTEPPTTEPTGLELALSVLEQQRELLATARAAMEAAGANTEYVINLIKENQNEQ